MVPEVEGNTTRLVVVGRREQQEFLFLGSPGELLVAVEVTGWRGRLAWLPLTLPDQVARLLWYLASLSLALALLNIVPCYLLDGQHVAAALAELLPLAPATRCPQLLLQSDPDNPGSGAGWWGR